MIRQLSILGNLRTWVYLSPNVVPIPTRTPMNRLEKKISKKIPTASKKLRIDKGGAGTSVSTAFGTYFWAVSKSTMAMASFNIDSPKMTVYSFGSTLYTLKIANMVTGSVADSVAPTAIACTKVI